MTLEESKNFLRNRGLSSCPCSYGGNQELVEVAIHIKFLEEEENKKTQP
jgi:hypothetical protein